VYSLEAMLVSWKVLKRMHKAVQEVEERHVYQKVLMEKINIEEGFYRWR
jgi:hypothetical protein